MILGLCGAAGAGKGSVALRLVKQHGYVSRSLADPLYEAVSIFTGLSVEELQDRRRKEEILPGLGMSPRRMLQTLGTEWGRNIVSRDIWVHHLFRRVGASDVVVADVRFLNEAQAIRRAGGTIWRVTRGSTCLKDDAAAHASEHDLNGFSADEVIENTGDLESLWACVDAAVRRLLVDTMK